jgi:hypothetical protein
MPDDRHPQDRPEDDEVDEAVDETFPASDPPAFSSGTATPSDEEGEPRSPGHLDADEDDDA